MKPILIDMKEMSDSREVYESRPHPFCIGFIYLILGILIMAVIWAAIFQIDIVVNGTGTVTVQGNSSTITNTRAGVVTECYIEDGQTVEKGETLYVIEHEDLDLELSMYETQNTENEQRIEMLDGYLKWLSGESLDLETYADNPFYTEYLARSRLVELNIDSAMQEYDNEQNSYQVKLQTGENVVSYYEEEISKLNQLRDAVKMRSNPFSSEDSYYYAKINDYLTQYQNTVAQYQLSISNLQSELETTFNKIAEAQAAIQEADALLAQTNRGEAEAGANQVVIQEAQAKKDVANSQITTQEAIAQEKQQEIATLETQLLTALSNLESETITGIETTILTYQQNLMTSQGNQEEIKSALDNITNTGVEGSIENLRQSEIQAVTAEISTYKAKQEELTTAIDNLQQEIDATLVCAPISGVINLSMDLVENDYLAAGATVMTIIPQDGNGYQVEAYVDNEDIAKIHSGMPVKYEIAAFPSSEYGVMTGEVEFVSADLKAENDTGSAYYMIETTIDDTDMLNQSGEEILLRSGMLCEVKIIVEQKSVLRYFFEKIKLLD